MTSERKDTRLTKEDVAIHKMNADVAKRTSLHALIYRLAKLVTYAFGVYIVSEALVSIATNSPDQLAALARVVDSASKMLRVNIVIPWVILFFALIVIFIDRVRIKRLIKKSAQLRRELEKADPGRTSSGLTQYGETPRGNS